MEVIGGVSAVAAVADQLLKACLTGYQLFTAAQNVGKELEGYLFRLGVSRQKLEDWITEVESDGKKLHDFIEPGSRRYQLILQTLARIASTFAEVERLKHDYGIFPVGRVADAGVTLKPPAEELRRTSASSTEPPGREGNFRRLGATIKTFKGMLSLRSKSPALPVRPSPSTCETARTFLGLTHALVLPSPSGPVPDPTGLGETDLNTIVPDLDRRTEDMKKKAAEYQQTIPALARYKWACTGGELPLRLVQDLKRYVGYLESLTKYPLERLKSEAMLRSRPLFDEFKVPWQLQESRLGHFCGREDILQDMEDFLTASAAGKGSAWKRAVVVLVGMGGIGKSQIALEYVYRHPEAYPSVFWVDATNQSTVCDGGGQILRMLIAHYSNKYRGGLNFTDVATDLGIPGRLDKDGVLADEIAKAPWPSVKRWLAREGNSRWCLVVDGLNVPEDGDRMRELLPACDHGHVIVTSRVRVADFKSFEVQAMDKISSLRLLLRDTFESASRENREAAQSTAEKLGHLPLALSQAAAYVVKRALNFVEYLKRLVKNMARYISEKTAKYPQGVVSCWQLSIQALMESNMRPSIDLLQLCSFLSPDGVSRELLVRGLSTMEWFDDDESQFDEAIDSLVMYALIKRKSSSVQEGEVYWIHPLVRHWAQDAYSHNESMVLETDETQLQRLHTKGYLQAVSLVGCSLKTRYDNREDCEWSFERRNMTHISLCLNMYIPKCDFAAVEAAATAKIALALGNFSGLKGYWGEYAASATIAESSISLYMRLMMSADPPRHLELEMLMVKQRLVDVNVNGRKVTSRALLEETLSRQRQLLPPGDSYLLGSEALKADELALEGRNDEALDQYRRCLDKMAEALDPGHPVKLATVHNLGSLYDEIDDLTKAMKFFDQALQLNLEHRGPNHPNTHIALRNVALIRHRCGDTEGELKCLKLVAEGSEAAYGLANQNTMEALRDLEEWYEWHGPASEAEAKALRQKILDGERILADANLNG